MIRQCMKVLTAVLMPVMAQAQQADIRLESRVTGNQEQPRVLYIVPWKTPGTSSDLFVPLQSQLNAVFEHVERPELVREMKYQQQLKDEALTRP